MHQMTTGVTEFLVPFFLVNIGMQLDLAVFRETSVVVFAVLLTLIAVVTKFAGCGLGAYGMQRREMAQIGIGMVPRGEGRYRRCADRPRAWCDRAIIFRLGAFYGGCNDIDRASIY